MKTRMVLMAVAALALLGSVVPTASADAGGGFTPVAQITEQQVIDALDAVGSDATADVFGGKVVAEGEHPYVGMVLLLDPRTGAFEQACSGSLIRRRYVLTAGHCTVLATGATGAAFIPTVNLDDVTPADVHVSSAVATDPRYGPTRGVGIRYDAGLLKLARPVDAAPIAVAGAVDDEDHLGGTEARVVGWGAIDFRITFPKRLRRNQIELLSTDGCHAAWTLEFQHSNMICGGSKVTDTCIGDSGGPLLVRDDDGGWLLHGITSYGKTACYPTPDAVYARVSAVRPWIERLTGLAPRRGRSMYRDVGPDERHFDSILTITDEDIATGLSDDTFRPDRAVTRAQMASFLARALGLEADGPPAFDDVDPDDVHAGSIAALSEAGITNGSDDGAFRPTDHVTRAQMASFLTRALDLRPAGAPRFSDVDPDGVHAAAIASIAREGISTGFPDGTFHPTQQVTRAQMAGFIARALDLQVLEPSI